MKLLIMSACFAQILAQIAIVNRIAYVLSRKLSWKWSNYCVRMGSRRLFTVLSTYLGFRFAGDYTNTGELPEQYLVLSNHQSLLDIPLFMHYLGPERLRFIAKAELGRNIPAVSLVLRSHRHCLIKRTGSPSSAFNEIDRFAQRVREYNWVPVIFPEGTRSRDGSIGKFHAAGFRRFMDQLPLPVAVCAVDGGWKINALSDIIRNMKGGEYRVKVLKVYPAPANKEEQVRILEEGRALIQNQLEAWRSE